MRKSVIKTKQGSSLLLVLVAMLLVILFGTVALGMSLSNIRMSDKVRDYNEEYYELEKAAQIVFKTIDSELIKVENLSLDYMEKEIYKLGNDKIYEGATIKYQEVQNFKKPQENQEFFNKIWQSDVRNKSYLSGTESLPQPVTDTKRYNELMENYFKECFARLYFNYCQKNLNSDNIQEAVKKQLDDPTKKSKVTPTIEIKYNINKKFDNFIFDSNARDKWNKYSLDPNDFIITVKLEDDKGKKIDGVIEIKPPIYDGLTTDRYRNYRVNPIWTNAIVAKNGIEFNGASGNIYGDVVSMGENGENFEINNSVININGNLAVANNIIFKNSSIANVKKTAGFTSLNLKKKVYSDVEWFYDNNDDRVVSYNITAPRPGEVLETNKANNEYSKSFHFIFDDMQGGNTYCGGKVFMDKSQNCKKSQFTTRNMLIKNGVQISENQESKIKVSDSFIVSKDEFSQNEKRDFDYIMNAVNASIDNREGIGVTKSDLELNYYDIQNGWKTIYPSNGSPYKVGISTYYGGREYPYSYTSLYRSYNSLNTILEARTKYLGTYSRSFESFITEAYIKGKDPDKTKINYINNNGVLDLSGGGYKSGVYYCDGDMTIKGGSGIFSGTIICKGKVKIEGKVDIRYDEEHIKSVLRQTEEDAAVKFFEIGELGKAVSFKVGVNVDAGDAKHDSLNNAKSRMRTAKERYKITRWVREAK